MVKNPSPFDKLAKRAKEKRSLLCVGLDPDFGKIPDLFRQEKFPQFEFNKWIIDQTHEYAIAFKPNSAFYEARGSQGVKELEMTMEYLHHHHPDIFTVLDAKRGDIGSTNQGYVTAIFDHLGFDAVTVHPYTGAEGLAPFLDRKDKVSIILCHTSNPGAKEIQDIQVQGARDQGQGTTVWQFIAKKVAKEWNKNQNCMLVVGATYPEELKAVREIVGDMWLLVPGLGTQGGDLEAVLQNGLNSNNDGLLINASRGVIFAENPAREAKKIRDQMCMYVQ